MGSTKHHVANATSHHRFVHNETELMPTLRQQAIDLFLATLQAIDIPAALRARITTHPLTIDRHPYPTVTNIIVIALGKAATPMARAARKTFEENYQDYALLTTVLALSESVFDKYAGSWADNVARSENIDTKKGYHSIHVQHDDGHSVDDDHSEDSWTLVKQALTPERYEEIEAKCEAWLDIWAQFADHVMSSSTD